MNKEAVKDLIEKETAVLLSRQEFDQKLRELRKENYVLEYENVK